MVSGLARRIRMHDLLSNSMRIFQEIENRVVTLELER